MDDQAQLTQVRAALPAVERAVYLNAGSVGPMSETLYSTLRRVEADEYAVGRGYPGGYAIAKEALAALRAAFGRLINAPDGSVAVTHHTTDGMNIVIHGLDWRPGDEILTTDAEHPGGFLPAFVVRQRQGVALRVVEIGRDTSAAEIVDRLTAAMTPRTRLLLISHVLWNLGNRLPLADLVAAAHARGVMVVCDAAQAIGAIPVDVTALGVDFYAMPAQKWLCGPEGLGALYVRPDRFSLLHSTFAGSLSIRDFESYDWSGAWLPDSTAKRFEVGSVYRPAVRGMLAHMAWLEETVGWPWIWRRTAEMHLYAKEQLAQVPGCDIITQPGEQAGLTSFALPGHDSAAVLDALEAAGIVLRTIREPDCLRISTGFYTSHDDIDRLVATLKTIAAGG